MNYIWSHLIYRLLCSDMVYVLLFPQLLLIVHAEKMCNKYGCVVSFFIGLTLRILSILIQSKFNYLIISSHSLKNDWLNNSGGEALLGLPAFIHYPFYEDGVQYFPFRTLIMMTSLLVHLTVSYSTEMCFTRGWLHAKYDFLQCYPSKPSQSFDKSPIGSAEGCEQMHTQF